MPILRIPMELRVDFNNDPYKASRDIACVPAGAIHPFFPRKHKVQQVMSREFENPFDEVTLRFKDSFLCDDAHYRYMHVDLSYNHDAVGIAMCHIPYWTTLERTNVISGKTVITTEKFPFIKFDFIGSIKAISGEQIVISDIREEVIKRISGLGYLINLITFDRFQSQETIQELRKEGFTVGNLSLDRTTTKLKVDFNKEFNIRKISTEGQYMSAWQSLKEVVNDGRAEVPYHPQFIAQAKSAEADYVKGKVFSYAKLIEVEGKQIRVTPSLDLLEAMAGACFNAIVNESEEYKEIKGDSERDYEESAEKSFYNDLDDPLLSIDDLSEGETTSYEESLNHDEFGSDTDDYF